MKPTTCVHAALLAIAFCVAAACGSAPRDNDAGDQKAWGTKMAREGFWREALFRYQRAAALRPNDPEILSNLAVAFEATGEPARALGIYRRALELAPEDQKIKRNYARFAEYYTSAQRAPAAAATGATAPAAAAAAPGAGAEAPPAPPATAPPAATASPAPVPAAPAPADPPAKESPK